MQPIQQNSIHFYFIVGSFPQLVIRLWLINTTTGSMDWQTEIVVRVIIPITLQTGERAVTAEEGVQTVPSLPPLTDTVVRKGLLAVPVVEIRKGRESNAAPVMILTFNYRII